jgi:hypothetical protein
VLSECVSLVALGLETKVKLLESLKATAALVSGEDEHHILKFLIASIETK